jgi:cell division protein FtsW
MNFAPSEMFEVVTAMEAFSNDGWSGLGPGLAIRYLPDSQTDFVLTAVVEDLGAVILCFALLALFTFIVIWRRLRARSNDDI